MLARGAVNSSTTWPSRSEMATRSAAWSNSSVRPSPNGVMEMLCRWTSAVATTRPSRSGWPLKAQKPPYTCTSAVIEVACPERSRPPCLSMTKSIRSLTRDSLDSAPLLVAGCGPTLALKAVDRARAPPRSMHVLMPRYAAPVALAAINNRLWHIAFKRADGVAEQLVAGREKIFYGYEFTIQGGNLPEDVVDCYVGLVS